MIYGSSDGDKSREIRLDKARRYASAILGLNDQQTEMLVLELYDYKGQLNVVWNQTKPTDMQKAAFLKAWEMCGENVVFHCVDKLWSEDV